MKGLRIGLVCPYSMSTPGGVQNHVLGLARWLAEQGHRPSILAPGRPRPGALTPGASSPVGYRSLGGSLAIPYNGSVARVNFGPLTALRTRAWLGDHDFDLVHVHEPITPSASLFAAKMTRVPVVATYHVATANSRALKVAGEAFGGTLARIRAHIAVSHIAREVARDHLGIDPVIIPNGFRAADFRRPADAPGRGSDIMFLGRVDEPRKGLDVLLAARGAIRRAVPEVSIVVVGPGGRTLPPCVRHVGAVSDARRSELLQRAGVFVAPHLGRESFGLVLVEAMAAGTPVVAADLPAFREVLTDDRRSLLGHLFPPGDPTRLAAEVAQTLLRPDPQMCAAAARHSERFDWEFIGPQILNVYNEVSSHNLLQ